MGRKEQRKAKKGNKKKKILIMSLIVIILVAIAILLVKHFAKGKKQENNNQEVQTVVLSNPIKIVNVNSKSRPYAVMINNNHEAWPHAGLQDAYLVYEMVVEGGITRMMAIFKDQDTAKIGSVRSSRHYYIDYAEENDAIYVHFGGSPQAYERLNSVDSIDGMTVSSCFWRDTSLNKSSEHTAFTNMEKVKAYAEKQGYTRDTKKDLLLEYSAEPVDMSTIEGAQTAKNIKIKYSDYHNTSYEYDETTKLYKRSMSGTKHTDAITKEQYTAKNIIAYQVQNYSLNDGENKGRQDMKNIGTGTGYYISEGYSVPITWEKTSHSGQTVYKYKDGKELVVNDGNTYIQIYPTDMTMTIQ